MFYPLTNNQREQVNHALEQYLCYMICNQQDDWIQCLPFLKGLIRQFLTSHEVAMLQFLETCRREGVWQWAYMSTLSGQPCLTYLNSIRESDL